MERLETIYLGPPTEEPGGLLSMGSHRVGHDWNDLAAAAAGYIQGFPDCLAGKNLPVNAGDEGLILGLARSPEEGNNNPFQYSCRENPMDRGAWWATVHGVVKELDTTEWLNNNNKNI